MGARGGNAPQGLVRRELRTLFLRAPYADFAMLAAGTKGEFRAKPSGAIDYHAPTPVVLYAVNTAGHRRDKLMILAEHRRERLLDIEEDDAKLAREGFRDAESFRRYWRARTGKRYDVAERVDVFTLQQFDEHDSLWLAAKLMRRLYGEFMP